MTTKRISLDISKQFDQLLYSLEVSEQVSRAEVLRRAVGLYALLRRELKDSDLALAIINDDLEVVKIFKSWG